MFGISQLWVWWNYSGGDGTQPRDDVSRLFEPPHMGIAGGKGLVCRWEARIVAGRRSELGRLQRRESRRVHGG
jgi:hypothetical protein